MHAPYTVIHALTQMKSVELNDKAQVVLIKNFHELFLCLKNCFYGP